MCSGRISRQLRRFIVSGLLATGFHAVIATTLVTFSAVAPPVANGLAFVLATVFSYSINTLWSFSRSPEVKNMRRYILVSVIGLFQAVSISAIAQSYGLSYLHGIALVILIVTPTTFMLHSFWTYA